MRAFFAAIGEAVWQVTLVDAPAESPSPGQPTTAFLAARTRPAQGPTSKPWPACAFVPETRSASRPALPVHPAPAHPGARHGRVRELAWKPVSGPVRFRTRCPARAGPWVREELADSEDGRGYRAPYQGAMEGRPRNDRRRTARFINMAAAAPTDQPCPSPGYGRTSGRRTVNAARYQAESRSRMCSRPGNPAGDDIVGAWVIVLSGEADYHLCRGR